MFQDTTIQQNANQNHNDILLHTHWDDYNQIQLITKLGFPSGSMVKNLPDNAGDTRDTVSIFVWKDSLEKEMATHSSILVWEIP